MVFIIGEEDLVNNEGDTTSISHYMEYLEDRIDLESWDIILFKSGTKTKVLKSAEHKYL